MWRKEEPKPQATATSAVPASAGVAPPSTNSAPVSALAAAAPLPVSPRAAACISQGIRIKGEISGKEDLFIDGTVDGKLEFGNASVTVGPNGKVKADISARQVIVRGNVEGKIDGTERVQLWNSGRLVGEVRTERLAIEDGAVLRGKVEAGKPQSRNEKNANNAATDSSDKAKSSAAATSSRTAVI